MTLKISIFINIILLILLLAVWFAKHKYLAGEIHFKDESRVVLRDTVIKIVPQEPIVITKTKAKIIKTRDTILMAAPFVMAFDTIVQRDTITASFEYPEQLFSLAIRRTADTNYTERIFITREKPAAKTFWETPLAVIGAVAAGYLIGRIK